MVSSEIPWRRYTSLVAAPARCSRKIAMICSSPNLLRLIVALLMLLDFDRRRHDFEHDVANHAVEFVVA
jgi:hypothetical protein